MPYIADYGGNMKPFVPFFILCISLTTFANTPSASCPVTEPCLRVLCEMAGTLAEDHTHRTFTALSTTESVSNESVPSQPPVLTASEKAVRAWNTQLELYRFLYGDNYGRATLATPTDDVALHARVMLRIAHLAGAREIPRKTLERITEWSRQNDAEIARIEAQIAYLAEQLGDKYRSIQYTRAVQTLEAFSEAMRVMGNAENFFKALLDPVYRTTVLFQNVITQSTLLSEAQVRLQFYFQKIVLSHNFRETVVLAALEDLLVANYRRDVDHLLPSTHSTIETFLRDHAGNEENLHLMAETYRQVQMLERELDLARREFGKAKEAADICWEFLTAIARPDPYRSNDMGNILNLAYPVNLADNPLLRQMLLVALSGRTLYIHPNLNREFPLAESPAALNARLSPEELDPYLSRYLDTTERRREEFRRALLQARQAELEYLRGFESERRWNVIQQRVTRAARDTVRTTLNSTGARGAIPEPILRAFLSSLAEPSDVRMATAPKEALNAVQPLLSLPTFLHNRPPRGTVQTPWKTDALDFTAQFPLALTSGGEAYTYLFNVLEVLNARAHALLMEDFTLQSAAAHTQTSIDPENRRKLVDSIGELLTSLSQVRAGLVKSYLETNGQRTAADADVELAWMVGQNFPVLQRLAINYRGTPSLQELRRKLVIHAIRSHFGAEDMGIAPERAPTRNLTQTIWRHRWHAGIGALVLAGASALGYFVPQWFQ